MKSQPLILVVDDQPQNVELLEAQLIPQGYAVVKALSGKEALERVLSNQVDLVLLDIMMPRMSGIEVLKKLRDDKITRLIPVVMVTALKENEDKIKALEAGCDDFISKPFDKVELLARVKSILKISDYLRQLDEKERFKKVVDKASDGIAICGLDYIIKDGNAAALKYLNITEAKNANLIETLFKDYSVSINKEALMDLTVAHKTFDIVRQRSETIEALYLEVNADLVKDPAAKVLSVVFIFRDVTTSRTEESLKQDTLTLIAHKLRTPVGLISGDIALLKDGSAGQLNPEQKKIIGAVSKQSAVLVSMVEELLGFTIAGGHSS